MTGTARTDPVEPFTIRVAQADLDDLRERLRRTRWPDALDGEGWAFGTDPDYLRQLVDHWLDRYDWRAEERRLNAFPQFLARVDGLGMHFVQVRSPASDPVPVLLLHGWPGSFVQMLDLVPLLADPSAHGSGAATGFDVVAASLPGFGFSEQVRNPGMTAARMADLFHRLMTTTLGYGRFLVHGTDFGAGVAEQLAARHPDAVIGVHEGGTSPRANDMPADPSPAVQQYARDVAAWQAQEVGYSAIQSTKPQTLAVALNDSPAGLAGWIVEKFRRWSDCGGDVERRFTKDQLLTNVMIYWLTGTIGSSVRLYKEDGDDPSLLDSPVPFGHLMSDRDMVHTPREWVERTTRVDRWTQVDRGGHFIEWEEPGLVADDIRAFLAEIG